MFFFLTEMMAMRDEAEEVSIDCCKSLVLMALNSRTVQNKLENLPEYELPFAIDVIEDEENDGKMDGVTWQQLKDEMNDSWDKEKKLLKNTEFHDFLEYVISETVFNITAEMLENFDCDKENILSQNDKNDMLENE